MLKFTLIFVILVMIFNAIFRLVLLPWYEEDLEKIHNREQPYNRAIVYIIAIGVLLNVAAAILVIATLLYLIITFL